MPIDPRIAMGFQSPQFEQPINVMGNFLKLKSMQQQNALAEQQMAELERQRSQNAFLNQAYSEAIDPQTGALNYNKLIGATARGGYGSLAPGLLKSKLETDEQTAKTRSAELKLFGDALGARRQVLGMIQTPEQFIAWHEGNHTDPVVGPMLDRMGIKPEESRATIVARLEKGELQNLIAESSMSMEEMIKNVKNVDVEGAVVGVTPTGIELWRKRKTPSASEAETRRHNLEMEGIARQRVSRTPTVGQTERAKIDAKFAAAAPQAIQDAENAIKLIDQMVGTGKKGSKPHPGFSGAVGAGIGTRFIPGTDAASFEAMHNQLMGGAFLQAYETLRGGGQITEIEGQKATAARNRMNLSQSETEYIKAAREYQDVLRSVIARAKQRMGSATDVTDVGSDSDWTDL